MMKTVDGMTSNWCGLWWHPEYNGFSSAPLNLSELKKYKGTVRLYVRKNKYFNGGENNRPNYQFCIKDAHAAMFENIEFLEDRVWQTELIEELADVMREGNMNVERACLASESAARAQWLHDKAIQLVEQLTGEKWAFTFFTY